MTPIEKFGYIAHSKTGRFRHSLNLARECIAEALSLCKNPCLSFSAGKDSSAMLWLVLEQKPDISARILTSGESRLMHPNLDEIFAWWQGRFPAMDFRELLMDRVFSDEWKDASFDEQRHAGKGDLQNVIPQSGEFDGWFIGLRSGESGWRRYWNNKRIPGTRHAIYRYKSGPHNRAGSYRVCPVAKWSEDDMGAMVALHGYPLPPTYDDEGMDGRTTMRMTNKALSFGALSKMRVQDPDAFHILIDRFPELRRYA